MNESKHTPGPWYPVEVISETGVYFAVQITKPTHLEESAKHHTQYNEICYINMYPPDIGTGDCDGAGVGLANAHLIAAAPELLGLCHEALGYMKDLIRTADIYGDGPDECIKDLEAAIAKAEGAKADE